MYSPLEQFKIYNILSLSYKNFDLTINNSNLILIINAVILLILVYIIYDNKLYSNKAYYIFEYIQKELNKMMLTTLTLYNNKYLVLIIVLFYYILINNLVGLIPYTFTTTSQLILTFTLSLSIMIGVTIIGLINNGLSFIYLFIPSGVPMVLIPFIFVIEVISYLSRVFSLAIRLSTNMIAGHVLIYIFSNFLLLVSTWYLFIILIMLLYILEIGVCVIQAYIFSVLVATYIKDSVLLH